MANVPASTPPGRMQSMRRSFTMPANLSTPKSSPGALQLDTPDGAETLFLYHTSKIISFTPPLPGGPSANVKHRRDSLDEEPEGVLPWGSHTERHMSTGSLRLYKVPGSTVFLQSGRTIHAIMGKSRCWCVDGESKFVLKIRGNNYYRIELPNSTPEDKKAVAELKTVLARILQYETTPCPFKRGFYVELPEKQDVILKPWKPKHSPITAKQSVVDAFSLGESSPGPGTEPSLRVAKGSDDLTEPHLLHGGLPQKSYDEEHSVPDDTHDAEPSTRYVEGIISNYEVMTPHQAETNDLDDFTARERTKAALSMDMDPSITSEQIRVNEGPTTSAALSRKARSPSPSPNVGEGPFHGSESSSQSDDNDSLDLQPSIPQEDASISTIDDAQDSLANDVRFKTNNEAFDKHSDPARHALGRSFTAPVLRYQSSLRSASISSSDHPDELVPRDLPSKASSGSLSHQFNHAASLIPKEVEDNLTSNDSGVALAQAAIPGEENFTGDTKANRMSLSEAGSSTPEWLDLSPPGSPKERLSLQTRHEDENQDSVDILELDDGKLSPASHLRHRLQQRRQISPMPSLTVLHQPSQEHPNVDFAVDVLQSLCRTIFILSVQIAVLIVGLLYQLLDSKSGTGKVLNSKVTRDEDISSSIPEADSSEDDFASVASDSESESVVVPTPQREGVEDGRSEDLGHSFQRAPSGFKSRRKAISHEILEHIQ